MKSKHTIVEMNPNFVSSLKTKGPTLTPTQTSQKSLFTKNKMIKSLNRISTKFHLESEIKMKGVKINKEKISNKRAYSQKKNISCYIGQRNFSIPIFKVMPKTMKANYNKFFFQDQRTYLKSGSYSSIFSKKPKKSPKNFQKMVSEVGLKSPEIIEEKSIFENSVLVESFASSSSFEYSFGMKAKRTPQTPRIKRNVEAVRKKKLNQLIQIQKNKIFGIGKTKNNYFSVRNLKMKKNTMMRLGDYCDNKDKNELRGKKSVNIMRRKRIDKLFNKGSKDLKLKKGVQMENKLKVKSGLYARKRSQLRKNLHFPDPERIFRILTRSKKRPIVSKKSMVLDVERVRLKKRTIDCFKT